jgi:hypothetical protein
LQVVTRDKNNADGYLIHTDLYTILARLRARELTLTSYEDRAPIMLRSTSSPERPAIIDGRQPARPGGPTDDELRAHFQQRLMESIGLSVEALQKILAPEIAHQALAAADLLKRKARSHRGLGDELRFLESTTRHNLEQARDVIAQQYEGDEQALALLNETLAEIDARVPTLILLPESRLIDSLIAALEESHAENRLGEDEDRLLARLRGLRKDLEAMDWNDEAAWGRLVHKIDRLNEAGPTASNIVGDGSKLH